MDLSFWQAITELWCIVSEDDREKINQIQLRELKKSNDPFNAKRNWSNPKTRRLKYTETGKELLTSPRTFVGYNYLVTSLLRPLLIKVIEEGELTIWAEDPETKKVVELPGGVFATATLDPGLPTWGRATIRSRDGIVIYDDVKIRKSDLQKIKEDYLAVS